MVYKRRIYSEGRFDLRFLIFFLLISLIHTLPTTAQKQKDIKITSSEFKDDILVEKGFTLSEPLKDQLLPLDSLLKIAIYYSPELKFQKALKNKAESGLDKAKNLWLNNIFAYGDFNTSNQNFSYRDLDTGVTGANSISDGYSVGAIVRVPLYVLFGRKADMNVMKAEIDATEKQYDVQKRVFQREIVKEYFNLIGQQEILMTQIEAYEAQSLNLRIMEMNMLDGQTPLADYARTKEVTTKAKTLVLASQRDFYTSFHRLENMIGVPLERLKR